MAEQEIWKTHPKYDWMQVSTLGRVVGRRGHFVGIRHNGYIYVQISRNRRRPIHQLVLETFVGPAPLGHIACHGPAGQDDNSLQNLYWSTHKRNNNQDKKRDGTLLAGDRHQNSILSDDDVSEIRKMARSGVAIEVICNRFQKVQAKTVRDVAYGNKRKSHQCLPARPGRTNLDIASVLEIRKRHADGQSQGSLAKMFKKGKTTIGHIIHRRSWTHI